MDRRFFVLTTTGERGPYTVDDLKREWQAGLVNRADHLRTALGKSAGTVGDMIGPSVPARSSGRMPVPISATSGRQSSATNLRPISETRRSAGVKSTSSGRNSVRNSQGFAGRNAPHLSSVLLGLGLVVLIAGVWWLTRSSV